MSIDEQGRVLVLGNDTRSFLSVIRSLGRKGLNIHIAWCDADCPANYSRYVRKYHEIPRYRPDYDDWKTQFKELLKAENFDLVIPCNDQSIIPLQLHRKELEPLARLCLLNDEVFRIVYSKQETIALARQLGIRVPKEVEVESADDMEVALSQISLPVVMKPHTSYCADNLNYHHDVIKAFSHDDARHIATQMLTKGPLLVQENFIGQGTGVEVIADKGEILAAFQHLRLHEPPHGGAASYRRSVPLHRELYDATAMMMKALGYTGVAMVEFKLNRRTNDWVLLEINGRFWGSLPLAVAAGIDFPWYLYQLLVKGVRKFNNNYHEDFYCRDITGDIDWFRKNRTLDRNDPFLHVVPTKILLGELGNILAGRERSDTFTLDDLSPAFREFASWTAGKLRAVGRRLSLLVKSSQAAKSLARRRAVRLLSNGGMILFVCTGNICRSPFAELASPSILGSRLMVESAGILDQGGGGSPANAVAAGRTFGVDLGVHVAARVSEKLVKQADLVFVFDQVADRYLRETYPFARRKVHYLGVFLDDSKLIIEDPFGGNLDVFRKSYESINAALVTLHTDLEREACR